MNPKIVVMDTNPHSETDLIELLGRAQMETVVVENPSEVPSVSPDAVIIDENTKKGGWTISSRIRNESNVPIVMLGNSDGELAWIKAVAYGVDYYLPRPFSPRELVARLKALIRRYNGTPAFAMDRMTRMR
jgi:DNA-binding response OmpR family regulator